MCSIVVCMNAHVGVYAGVYVHVGADVHTRMCIYIYVCVCVCVRVYV